MNNLRSKKIEVQLKTAASFGLFYIDMSLYLKEAKKYRASGFTVNRLFCDEKDHPERNSFYYRISWEDATEENSFAYMLYTIAKSIQ